MADFLCSIDTKCGTCAAAVATASCCLLTAALQLHALALLPWANKIHLGCIGRLALVVSRGCQVSSCEDPKTWCLRRRCLLACGLLHRLFKPGVSATAPGVLSVCTGSDSQCRLCCYQQKAVRAGVNKGACGACSSLVVRAARLLCAQHSKPQLPM